MKPKYYTILVVIVSFFFASCGSGAFVNLKDLKSELKLKHFPTQKDYPEADALVLSENHDVDVIIESNYDLETVETFTKVTKLFKNIDHYASIKIDIGDGESITDIHARTIKPDGTSIVLKDKDFYRTTGTGDGEVFYSNSKTIKFTFPAIEKNCIIEYGYTKYENYPFIMGRWQIQSYIPKLRNSYKLTVPLLLIIPPAKGGAGWDWRYKPYNVLLGKPKFINNINTTQSQLNKMVSFEWNLSNIPAFKPESFMPPYSKYVEYVKFAPSDWKSWNKISGWYYRYFFKPQLIITKDIKAKAQELSTNCKSEAAKIDSIYQYIQRLRYVAIELDQGSIMPTKPQTVLNRQYGDCKDKSILLVSLLKSAGIKAKPVLVLTSDNGSIDNAFPSWNFNHMIVYAKTKNGKEYWMDPTVDHCNLGELPYQCQNINVLVLNDDGTSKVERTPKSSDFDNVKNIHMKVSLVDKNEALFNIKIKYKGQYNLFYRDFFDEKTHDEMIKYCKSLVVDDYINAKIEDYSIDNVSRLDTDLVLNIKLKVPNAVQQQGDLYFLNVDPFKLLDSYQWLSKDKREYDIDFNFPHEIDKKLDIELPKGVYKIRNLPSNSNYAGKGLFYSKEYKTLNDDHFTVKESFSILSKRIKAEYYKNVKYFFNRVKNKLNEKVILTTK